MTNLFSASSCDPINFPRKSFLGKIKYGLAFLILGAAGSAFAGDPLTYDDGDLFLGFRATDRPNDYLVNIKQPTPFLNVPPGTNFQVNTGNLQADLVAAFGSDWYTRIDQNTGRSAVLWAVTGGRIVSGGGDPANILYSTNPSSTPWPRNPDALQSFTTSLIAAMGNNFAGNQPTANNPMGLIQNAQGSSSYAAYQPGGAHSSGISFATWNPWNEGTPNVTLFFNRIIPGSGPSEVLGFFTLSSNGLVGFTGGTTPPPTPTPTGTPGTPTPTPTITPTPTPSGTPGTPTPTPPITPTPTPAGTPTKLGNISTRLKVETGNNALIGGFIVTGTQPKKIVVRAIGPSLSGIFNGTLADPVLELHDSNGVLLIANNDWRTDQETEIIATGLAPTDDLESAIVATVPANAAYTAIVRGNNDGTGIAVVEVYDIVHTVDSKLGNISTRGLVGTGNNVMIAGTIVLGQNTQHVLIRAIGPSLAAFFDGVLADPTLELRDANGALIRANDNWHDDPAQAALIMATGIPPTDDLESAIVEDLPSGAAAYTAIVRGVNEGTGIALVEIYGLQ